MIYYQIIDKPGDKKPLALVKKVWNAKDNNKTDSCDIHTMPRQRNEGIAAIEVGIGFSILMSILWDAVETGLGTYEHMFLLPVDPDLYLIPVKDAAPTIS